MMLHKERNENSGQRSTQALGPTSIQLRVTSVAVLWCSTYLVLFFFQAEDGIRDLTVTGVQTCALPISRSQFSSQRPAQSHPSVYATWQACTHFRSRPPQRRRRPLRPERGNTASTIEIGRASCRERV